MIGYVPSLGSLFAVSKIKSPVAAPTSPELLQQLIPVTFSLDLMRRSVDQLAAKQEQMAQNIAALQAVDEEVKQKLSAPPPVSPTQQPAAEHAKAPQHRVRTVRSLSAQRPASPGTGVVSR